MFRLSLLLLLAALLSACVVSQGPPVGPPPVSPSIPNQIPVLLENQWRLTEVIHNAIDYDFHAIEPVLVRFTPGRLGYQACNAGSVFFDTQNTEEPNEYRLLWGASTARDCLNGGSEQEGNFTQALIDTNRYEIEGDRLVLLSENAHLTFVIDNEATKPPDWW